VTVSDLIAASLKRLRVVQAGEVPAAEDQADALLRLNSMVKSWSLQPGTFHRIVRTTWTIVANQVSYTVGTGGEVNITRPASPSAIEGIAFQDTSTNPVQEYGRVAPLTEAAYASIPQKAVTSLYPSSWYYAPTVPTGTLYPFPIPTSVTLQGVIYVPTPISSFSATTDTITLPDGYDLALQENLAVLLAPEWGVPLDSALVQSARESKMAVTTRNLRMQELSTAEAVTLFGRGGRSNIFTGDP
jgi:hypothetical protein